MKGKDPEGDGSGMRLRVPFPDHKVADDTVLCGHPVTTHTALSVDTVFATCILLQTNMGAFSTDACKKEPRKEIGG